jgi:hypothetical protein
MDFCDDIEVQYHSDFVEDILQEFVINKPTMHVMMMLTIDESYAFLDIPGGKRRLSETSKKGAIQETYEETSYISMRMIYKLNSIGKQTLSINWIFSKYLNDKVTK